MRGGDSVGIRAYNERLIVSAILRDGALSKASLARATGLSANAAMVIVNSLIEQGLLLKLDPVRGHVGQPSTPIAVNPAGALSIGVKIGRRGMQALLVDLSGKIVAQGGEDYRFPDPHLTIRAAQRHCRALLGGLDAAQRDRVVGLGIAMPDALQAWSRELGLEPGALDGWKTVDVVAALSRATGLDATLCNDATAACAAEMIAGTVIVQRSALYIYFGTFIGGGIVIGGRLYRGERQNAGSVGSMPAGSHDAVRTGSQLIHCASLLQLETMLEAAGLQPVDPISDEGGPDAENVFRRWMDAASPAVARAVVSALSVIDFETVVIDGRLPPRWRQALTSRIGAELQAQNLSGLLPAAIAAGSLGATAPVLGAAMLPLRARFSPDPDLLVRPA